MVFNSLVFFIFIFTFVPVYFLLREKARLWWSFLGSVLFYGWWDWRFLGLIAISTVVDFWLGLAIDSKEDNRERKKYIIYSMVLNLGFLGFFKYFNFFAASFSTSFGIDINNWFGTIILPVGISFYTFQSMSYTIDVYRKEIKAEKSLLRFSTFVSFFPQLVAGPIVRAQDFLPQFQKDHTFQHDRFIAGLTQILWGFYKKVAIADSLAPFVDQCFSSPGTFGSLHLVIGIIFYSFQIYCDFSGYSDIAIGLARILGYDFPDNFRTPYFSRNFSEFWTRWHISLSSWLRDYLYIPLGGNRGGGFGSLFFIAGFALATVLVSKAYWLFLLFGILALLLYFYAKSEKSRKIILFTYLNLSITMLLGGLWHGANWAFVFWGFLHGSYLIIQRFMGPAWGRVLNALRIPLWMQHGMDITLVYLATLLAWIYFRAGSMGESSFQVANLYLKQMLSFEGFRISEVVGLYQVAKGILLIGILLFVEIINLRKPFYLTTLQYPAFRMVSFAALLLLIAFFGTFSSNAFIYFQF